MPDMQSIADRIYYANRREYTVEEGNVAYLDGSPLKRPITMPAGARVTMLAIVAVAAILGFVFINTTVLSSLRQTAATEQAIADNLARQSSLETVPKVADLLGMKNKGIKSSFSDAGYTMLDASEILGSDDMILYKLPSDMTEDEAVALVAQGMNSLDAVQATKFLNGSWSFTAERSGATSMVVRYADFSTGDPQAAVQAAIEQQGIDTTSISESGVDDSGNTFSMGTAEVDGKAYSWKISALQLLDMFAISGMPDNSCYVGIRYTAQ